MLDRAFVIIRHIRNSVQDGYWKLCYQHIRKYHQDKIYIIDDNSSYPIDVNYPVTNCEIIRSQYPRRGELLPYYYGYVDKWAQNLIILHDSVFINQPITMSTQDCIFLFDYNQPREWYIDGDVVNLISKLNNSERLLELHSDKSKWKGCFGIMSIVNWNYLEMINKKYNYFQIMLTWVVDRNARMCLENVWGCICWFELVNVETLHGDIGEYCLELGNILNVNMVQLTFQQYLDRKFEFDQYPIVKVFSQR